MRGPADRRLWLPYGTCDDCSVRLICLPHAGAGAAAFLPWRARLGPDIGVCPIQLPGRESRMGEEPYRDVRSLTADLLPVLLTLTDRPLALYGHSLGALSAFEIARGLRAAGIGEPLHLFVSGRAAPHVADRRERLSTMPPEDLIQQLRALGGTDEKVLRNREVMGRFIPTLRADMAMNENYRHEARPPLRTPITAYGGTDDPRASGEDLLRWREITTASFELRLFSGGHFAMFDRAPAMLAHVRSTLQA